MRARTWPRPARARGRRAAGPGSAAGAARDRHRHGRGAPPAAAGAGLHRPRTGRHRRRRARARADRQHQWPVSGTRCSPTPAPRWSSASPCPTNRPAFATWLARWLDAGIELRGHHRRGVDGPLRLRARRAARSRRGAAFPQAEDAPRQAAAVRHRRPRHPGVRAARQPGVEHGGCALLRRCRAARAGGPRAGTAAAAAAGRRCAQEAAASPCSRRPRWRWMRTADCRCAC